MKVTFTYCSVYEIYSGIANGRVFTVEKGSGIAMFKVATSHLF